MEKIYLNILEDTLEQKKLLLNKVLAYTEEQQRVLIGEIKDSNYIILYKKKAELISEIEKLDEGFKKTYNRIRNVLDMIKTKYGNQLKKIKGLVEEIYETSIRIQALEAKNQKRILLINQSESRGLGLNRKNITEIYKKYSKK